MPLGRRYSSRLSHSSTARRSISFVDRRPNVTFLMRLPPAFRPSTRRFVGGASDRFGAAPGAAAGVAAALMISLRRLRVRRGATASLCTSSACCYGELCVCADPAMASLCSADSILRCSLRSLRSSRDAPAPRANDACAWCGRQVCCASSTFQTSQFPSRLGRPVSLAARDSRRRRRRLFFLSLDPGAQPSNQRLLGR